MTKKLPFAFFPAYAMAFIRHKKVDAWAARSAKNFPQIHPYFDTWQEAHDYLSSKAQKRLDDARRELKSAERHFAKVKAMVPPTPTQQTQE